MQAGKYPIPIPTKEAVGTNEAPHGISYLLKKRFNCLLLDSSGGALIICGQLLIMFWPAFLLRTRNEFCEPNSPLNLWFITLTQRRNIINYSFK